LALVKPQRPLIETWYKSATGEIFEVIAVDGDAIEIQYLDGSVEELDREAWGDALPRKIAPPHERLRDEEGEAEHPAPRAPRDETRSRYNDEWIHGFDEGQEDDHSSRKATLHPARRRARRLAIGLPLIRPLPIVTPRPPLFFPCPL